MSLDGTLLDPQGILMSTFEAEQSELAAAWDATNYLVVWTDDRPVDGYDVYGSRVSPTGELLDGPGLLISSAELAAQAAHH